VLICLVLFAGTVNAQETNDLLIELAVMYSNYYLCQQKNLLLEKKVESFSNIYEIEKYKLEIYKESVKENKRSSFWNSLTIILVFMIGAGLGMYTK